MTNEEKIITQIKKNLLKLDTIKEENIIDQLNRFRKIPFEYIQNLFDLNDNEVNWSIIDQRIREQVAIDHNMGFGIDDNNILYNIEWFTEFIRTNGRGYYWTRFIELQSEKLPPNVVKAVRDDTEAILNRCGTPDRKEVKDIRGLVFGFVQSGKTLNYTSISNAAMDSGYNIIIVLAGATKVLRKQTQDRVNKDVIGWDGQNVVGVGVINDELSKRPISLTNIVGDFNKNIADQQLQGANLSNISTPVIAVIKKNVSSIKNLNKWLSVQTRQGKINKSILLIDDESDYASVNTKKNEDPTAINKGLRIMLNYFDVSTYLAITATPFANILINSNNEHEDFGEDLFPKSFIWSLNKPSSYSGVKELVIESFKNIYNCNDQIDETSRKEICSKILKMKSEDSFNDLPYFFDEAIATFFSDVYTLRNERTDQDDISMMINISRFTKHHEEISGLIEQRKDKLIDNIRSLRPEQFKDPILLGIQAKKYKEIKKLGDIIFWKRILEQLLYTVVIGVHVRSKTEIEFSKGRKMNFIMVGGLSLSRGFTIEGLITSVFLRSTRTYDALMQMGRWFGHKEYLKKLEVLSLFTTPEIQSRYETIEEATKDLLDQIQIMRERKETPREFGLGIKYDPLAALQVVASNKARSATQIRVNLGMNGRNCETTKLYIDPEIIQKNKLCIEKFLANVMSNGKKVEPNKNIYFPQIQNDTFVYSDVDSELVVTFLNEFDVPFKKLTQISPKLPFPILIDYLKQKIKTVDVMIIEGGNTEAINLKNIGDFYPSHRKFENRPGGYINQTNNQITKPTDEAFLLTKRDFTAGERKLFREVRAIETGRPLFMIYPIMASIDDNDLERVENYAWSISTPGKIDDEKGKLVYANNVLLQQLEAEDDSFFIDYETDEEL